MTTLAEDYLDGRYGSSAEYRRNLERGQRIGQAFFNALAPPDQMKIVGTLHDCFHFDNQKAVEKAIDYLLST